jgi:hypothetical protein
MFTQNVLTAACKSAKQALEASARHGLKIDTGVGKQHISTLSAN